jgi:iron complex outermembrane receptor protein
MTKKPIYCWPGFKGALVLLICSAANLSAQNNATNAAEATPQQLKKLSLEDLMNLDVTSVSKQPQPYAQAPAAIEVITADDILRSGASSLPEALRLADGLDVAQINSHDWAISARGFNNGLGNKLLVMMDGRSIYTPLYAGVFWDAQDYLLKDIDRIEVVDGPGGTLWGANAVNGVINIISKSAQETQGLYLEAGGGNQLQDFAGVRYGTVLASNLYFRVYGKYFDRAGEVFTNGAGAGDAWNMGQSGFRMDWDPTSQNQVTFQGDIYDGAEESLSNGLTQLSGGNLLGRFSHSFSEDADVTVQLYYDETHRFVPNSYHEDLTTDDLDIHDRFSLGAYNRIVWGGGYRFTDDRVVSAPSLAFLPPDLDQNLFNTFVQDEIMLTHDLHLTLGTKVEHNDYTGFEVEPSGRLAWDITPQQMLWGAVSRAVRMPSRIDEDLYAPGNPPYVLAGGSNFVSETLLAYELGYRAQLTQKITGSISAYYNDYDNLRSLAPPTTPGGPYYFENNLEGDTYGFEVNSTWQVLDWWRLHGGYDLLQEHLHIKPGSGNVNDGETDDPQQQFSFRSSMDLTRNVQFDVEPRWVDQLVSTSGTVPAYVELDARLAWRISRQVEISIVGQNLVHSRHVEFGAPGPTQEEIERSVYGKVTWQF